MRLVPEMTWQVEQGLPVPKRDVIPPLYWHRFPQEKDEPEDTQESEYRFDPCDWITSGAREKKEWRWIQCANVTWSDELKEQFNELVQRWRDETEDYSIIILRFAHPAFLRIVALGKTSIPWILSELKERPDWWFEALEAITGEDPTNPEDSFDSAVEAWLQWGKSNGYAA